MDKMQKSNQRNKIVSKIELKVDSRHQVLKNLVNFSFKIIILINRMTKMEMQINS